MVPLRLSDATLSKTERSYSARSGRPFLTITSSSSKKSLKSLTTNYTYIEVHSKPLLSDEQTSCNEDRSHSQVSAPSFLTTLFSSDGCHFFVFGFLLWLDSLLLRRLLFLLGVGERNWEDSLELGVRVSENNLSCEVTVNFRGDDQSQSVVITVLVFTSDLQL